MILRAWAVSAHARFQFNAKKALEVFRISSKELLINEEIRDKEVRLVGTEGEQLGVVPLATAQNMAIEKNLDLVKIAPQATPPVCKLSLIHI